MGYSQSWVAVPGKTPAAVLETLGLRRTGTREEIVESPFGGAELPSGWYLVVANRSGHRLMREPILARLSMGGEAVAGDVEEHLEAQGELPAAFAEIRDRSRAQQTAANAQKDDVDYIFEIPVELARAVTGYRHDAALPAPGTDSFDVLEAAGGGETKSWLGRLLGR